MSESASFQRVRCRNAQPEENQQKSEKYTSFGSNRSPGQPSRTKEIAIQKMSRHGTPAVGDSVEVTLRPIPRRVKSYRHPEIAAPAQQQAKEQSPRTGVKNSQPVFAGITHVAVAEYC